MTSCPCWKAVGEGRLKGRFSVPARLQWWRHIPQNTWRWQTGDSSQTFVCHAVWDLVCSCTETPPALPSPVISHLWVMPFSWTMCGRCWKCLLIRGGVTRKPMQLLFQGSSPAQTPWVLAARVREKARLPSGSSICTCTSGQRPKISWERHLASRVLVSNLWFLSSCWANTYFCT